MVSIVEKERHSPHSSSGNSSAINPLPVENDAVFLHFHPLLGLLHDRLVYFDSYPFVDNASIKCHVKSVFRIPYVVIVLDESDKTLRNQ